MPSALMWPMIRNEASWTVPSDLKWATVLYPAESYGFSAYFQIFEQGRKRFSGRIAIFVTNKH